MNKAIRAYRIVKNEGIRSLVNSTRLYFQKWSKSNFLIAFIYFFINGKIIFPSDRWKVVDLLDRDNWLLPSLDATYHITKDYRNSKTSKYYSNDHIEIDEDDTIFETGAYIGATTKIAAKLSSKGKVFAIEPSPRNINCLKYNLKNYQNIKIIEAAAWDKNEKIEIEYGTSPDDDSIFTPDKGTTGERVTVTANTIECIAEKQNISVIDYLKVEAEGSEPEIIDGIGDIQVNKIAVSGGPERNGEPTHDIVVNKLRDRGYDVTKHNNMVYARLRE